MDEYESLSHSKWECKYHIVFIPKCLRKVLYGNLRQHLGEVSHRLAEQKECVAWPVWGWLTQVDSIQIERVDHIGQEAGQVIVRKPVMKRRRKKGRDWFRSSARKLLPRTTF
jgi:hypothetical protein